MTTPEISRRRLLEVVAVVTLTASCLATWIGLSSATTAPELPPWVECDTPDIEPHKQFASPCRVSMPDLPDELLVLDVNGEVVGSVDARLLFRPPAPSAEVHENTGNQYHPDDPPLEVFGPSDDVVGIVDNTGFVPEEEIP
jgi:hypothetical protein